MAVVKTDLSLITGLSTDRKPKLSYYYRGIRFYETDTRITFVWEGNDWVEYIGKDGLTAKGEIVEENTQLTQGIILEPEEPEEPEVPVEYITFSKENYALIENTANRDLIIPDYLEITRSSTYGSGMFNYVLEVEDSFDDEVAPMKTLWKEGTLKYSDDSHFSTFKFLVGSQLKEPEFIGRTFICKIENDGGVNLEEDNVFEVSFNSWTIGSGNGGGFSYKRTNYQPISEMLANSLYENFPKDTTFTKEAYANVHEIENRDVIIPGYLELTRGDTGLLLNYPFEQAATHSSPLNTSWQIGSLGAYSMDRFTTLKIVSKEEFLYNIYAGYTDQITFVVLVNKDDGTYLEKDSIMELTITDWSSEAGGSFTYTRTALYPLDDFKPPLPPPVEDGYQIVKKFDLDGSELLDERKFFKDGVSVEEPSNWSLGNIGNPPYTTEGTSIRPVDGDNAIIGTNGVIGGGSENIVIDDVVFSTGTNPLAFPEDGFHNTISGGNDNVINGGGRSTISGGVHNLITGLSSVIAGGHFNRILGDLYNSSFNAIGGGINNTMNDGYFGVIGGGHGNTLSGLRTTIGGGGGNTVGGEWSTIAGGNTNYIGNIVGGFIGGGQTNVVQSNDAGYGDNASVVAGINNTVGGNNSFIGGGVNNIVLLSNSFVGGGQGNEVQGIISNTDGHSSAIVGGKGNTIAGFFNFIGGGWKNEINNDNNPQVTTSECVLVGGTENQLSGWFNTIGGGNKNLINFGNYYATISGGIGNSAKGDLSFIGGGKKNVAASFGEIALGIFPTLLEGNRTAFIDTDRLFNLGNGLNQNERSDAFTIFKNGIAILPTVTNTLIDNGSGKTVVTKEWVEANAGGGGDAPTGLEAIDEGNGIGYRLIGRDPALYTELGLDAIDFGYVTNPTEYPNVGSSGAGATTFGDGNSTKGILGFTTGYGNINEGDYSSIIGGYYNTLNIDVLGTLITGANNTAELLTDMSFVAGDSNTVRGWGSITTGSINNNRGHSSGVNWSSVFGKYNNSLLTGGIMGGIALHGDSTGTAIFGQSNTVYTGSNGIPNRLIDPVFIVGNGLVNNDFSSNTRSDAFKILLNGTVTAPSLDTTLIDNESTGRVLTTREWVTANTANYYPSSITHAATYVRIAMVGTADLDINAASASAAGVITADTQTIGGDKTFTGTVEADNLISTATDTFTTPKAQNFVTLTEAEFTALVTKDPNTIYITV